MLFAPLEKSSFFWAENLDSKSQYLEVFEETNSDFHKFTPFFSVKKVNFVEKKDLNFSLTDELRRKRSSITGFDRDVSGSYLNSYFDAAPSWNFAVYRLNIMPLVESGLFNGVVNSNVRELFKAGGSKVLLTGDSIIAGGGSSSKYGDFPHIESYASRVCDFYKLDCENTMFFPGRSLAGVFEEKLIQQLPSCCQIMIFAYGMNDQAAQVSAPEFGKMADEISTIFLSRGGKQIVFVPIIKPYHDWAAANYELIDKMNQELKDIVTRNRDKFSIVGIDLLWDLAIKRKSSLEMLRHINHPNDFGHFLHFLAFRLAFSL